MCNPISKVADASAELVRRVEEAYQEGLRQPLPYRPQSDDDSILLGQLPIEDKIRITESEKARSSAMEAAQSDDLESAKQCIQAAEKLMDLDAMERESVCVGLQLHKGVESYILYKDGEYEAARQSMKKALQLTKELQEKFGYGSLDARRVHLARNLLRLDAHGDSPGRAARAAFKLLLYTTGEDQAWPYPASQSTAENRRFSEARQHMVFNQVARELVLMFIHADAETRSVLIAEGQTFEQHLRNSDPLASDTRNATTLEWLSLKNAFLEDRPDDFLEQAVSFFRDGRSVPALWYGVARDVVLVCNRMGGPDAQSLQQQILDDVGTRERLRNVGYGIAFKDE